MDLFANLATGFGAAASWQNLGFALIGCLLGTLIGVLPGIGPIPTIAMLLPITFGLDPLSSLIMLAGIYYGAQYGGSTTSILVNMPGEASSIVTCIDGHQMARQGRAGAALAIAALGSFFAGCVGTVFVAAFGPPLATLAQQFNSPDYFSLMVLGLVTAVMLAHGSVIKAIGDGAGRAAARPGRHRRQQRRRALHLRHLGDLGRHRLPAAGDRHVRHRRDHPQPRAGRLPARAVTIAASSRPVAEAGATSSRPGGRSLRGTGLGAILGILPGGGAVLASFASYTLEKKVAKDPRRFGKGAIEGVAGPEAPTTRRRRPRSSRC